MEAIKMAQTITEQLLTASHRRRILSHQRRVKTPAAVLSVTSTPQPFLTLHIKTLLLIALMLKIKITMKMMMVMMILSNSLAIL